MGGIGYEGLLRPGVASARGKSPAGFPPVRKFGKVTVGTSLLPVWTPALAPLPFLTAANTLTVVSDDTTDGVAGVGARVVKIFGLDEDFLPVDVEVVMDGTTPVITTQAFTRVFRAYVMDVGTYCDASDEGANAGTVTITATVDTRVMAEIPAQAGQTLMAIYTVPAGRCGFVNSVRITVDSVKSLATASLFTRANANDVTSPFRPRRSRLDLDGIGASPLVADFKAPIRLVGPCDVWVAVTGGAIGTDASAEFDVDEFTA